MSDRDIVSEPLRGWRGWKVVESPDGPVLASWWVSVLWPVGRALQARCGMHGSRPTAHHVCGIHAFTARFDALAYLDWSHDAAQQLFARRPERELGVAVGRVTGWGRAVRHTRGWRSEFAYPYDLYLLGRDRALARALAGRYAVEVSPFPADT